MNNKISVANLKISAITKLEFLADVKSLLSSGQQTFITTPNSEFLFAALRNKSLETLFNSSDIALADGISIMWAERFLASPFKFKNYWLKVVEAWLGVVITGARILLTPRYLYKNIPEKITGADVFFDLIKLAAEENKSVFFVNHRSDSAQTSAKILNQKYPNLKIVGVSRKNWDDLTLLEDIKNTKPDMLFVSYGQPAQEKWISKHLKTLPVSIAMGVGGTFDYAAGFKTPPPSWIRSIGLEWLFRLFTQPKRLPRIYNATWGLILSLVRFKIFSSQSYRKNASSIVVNGEGKILLISTDPKRIMKNGQYDMAGTISWLFPQGGIETGEDIIESAQRELEEETNISKVEVLGLAKYVHTYDWLNGFRSIIFSKRRNRGQEQYTVFFKYNGDGSEVVLEKGIFKESVWLTPEQVMQKIDDVRKPSSKILLEELKVLLEKTS